MKCVVLACLLFSLCLTRGAFASVPKGEETMIVPINNRMSNAQIEKILRIVSKDVEGQLGQWQFTYRDVKMMCITDESQDRMRIMSARAAVEDISHDELMTRTQ